MCKQSDIRTAGREHFAETNRHFCRLKCCTLCSYCARAFAKERNKSRGSSLSFSKKLQNKICEACFLCHSVILCQTCSKCQRCCLKSSCRRQTSEFLADLVEARGQLQGRPDLKVGLHPPLSEQAPPIKTPNGHKPLCKPPQEQLPVGGFTSAYFQKCSGASTKPKLSRFLQPTFPGAQTQQQMEAHSGLEQSKSLSKGGEVQDGNTGNHQNFSSKGRMGNLCRFQGRLLPHTYTGKIKEIPEISCPGSDIPIQGSSIWSVHSTIGIHGNSQGSKVDGHAQGYKDPPVPRRLVGEGHVLPSLYPAHKSSAGNVPGTRLGSQQREIRTGSKTSLRLCRIPVRPQIRSGQTHTRPVAESQNKDSGYFGPTDLSGPAVYVLNRSLNSHRKTGSPRPTPHETHSVAPQKQLEGTGIFGKDHPYTQVPAPSSAMVVRRKQCATRPTITPSRACSTDLYRRIKRRVGRSLKRAHCKGPLVGSGKQTAHKLSRVESSLSSSQRVPRTMYRQDSSSGIRQHYSSGLYKQRRRYEVGPSMCPTLEDPDLVLPETSDVKSPSHPGPSERDSRQAIQTRSDHTDRVVPPPGGISKHMQEVAPTSSRSVCHKIQPQTSSVCLSSPGPPGCSSGCSHSAMGGPGCICLSTDLHLGQSSGEATGLPVPESYSDCSRVAQHALVLGLGGHVQSNSPQPTKPAQSLDTAVQPDPSQESDKPESPCMAPRATAIKEQGFSKAVAARIEAPQRKSTRSVYEAKWTIFTKWCITNQVDFGSPPIKSVADFLLYLFEVKKLQPSTIDGYRSAIADKLGNTTVNISKDDNLTRLLDSFHRDRPRGRRGIPSWNLSLVLHQLTKAPFEPLKEASMKHLTFKTVFLLALGSGKRRSEIHAWQHKNIRHQSDWSKVSLFPSPSFLSKNQLAKEGPESVAPVVIPALAPTLDRSLKSDRTLCPVRALRYYLDRTSDLRQGKELVFVSFKKGFDKDISPATISSWIKQTVILCYELSDHQAHTLHQVKAHDVRAFAASKAFQSGVSLEQILSACHWKSHNTFTQFYLKDVAWADSELYHLGPVVAAQQIHQQAST